MGLKTDIASLGAIGLGTAVAVIGTGGVLIAGALHQAGQQASCVDVAAADFDIRESFDVIEVSGAPRAIVLEVSDDLRDVAKAPQAPDAPMAPGAPNAPDAPNAPEAPELRSTKIVVSSGVQLEIGECADQLHETVTELRIHAEEARAQARATAGEARAQAEEARALAEELRAEAMAVREAALAEVERAKDARR